MPKKKSVAEMSEKERRRHSKKIEKQIRQGKKKIKLPDGRVLDGKRIREQRTTGSELRGYYQRIQLYLTGVVITAITARVFTAWEIPAGFRVLVFLLCVPIFFGLQVLLNALVPQKVNHEQRQIVVEGGGSYYNALFTLAMTIELTKFVQYFLAVVRGASDSTDEGDDAESITADGETPDDENWTPPPPKKQFFEMSQQSNMTKVFLYGIPFMFGAAVVLFGMVAFLRATSRDPLFGGNNLRSVRMTLPMIIIVGSSFIVSTILEFVGSDSIFLHPLWATIVLLVLIIVGRNFMPAQRKALRQQFEQLQKQRQEAGQ